MSMGTLDKLLIFLCVNSETCCKNFEFYLDIMSMGSIQHKWLFIYFLFNWQWIKNCPFYLIRIKDLTAI